MMDGTYYCENCGKNEQAYKCVHLEEGKVVVCADCFYKAQEITDKMPWTLEDVKEGEMSEETLKKKRNDYLATLRRHSEHFRKHLPTVVSDFLQMEVDLAPQLFSAPRKDLKVSQINRLTNYIRETMIPNYFGRLLSVKELKKIPLSDYYTHKDYELRLRTILKNS